MTPEKPDSGYDPVAEAEKIVKLTSLRGEAEEVGARILGRLGELRDILNHQGVVINVDGQYSAEEERQSLILLQRAQRAGQVPAVFEVNLTVLNYHLRVVNNYDGRYPRGMRKESREVLKSMLIEPGISEDTRKMIRKFL